MFPCQVLNVIPCARSDWIIKVYFVEVFLASIVPRFQRLRIVTEDPTHKQ